MPAGVYACDAHGRFDYWNRNAVELWGQEPDVEDRFWAMAGGPRVIVADGSPEMEHAKTVAAQESFQFVARLPVILLVVFGVIWLIDKRKGGFKPEKL